MASLEDLKQGVLVEGVIPGQSVTVVAPQWIGTSNVNLVYTDQSGSVHQRLLSRSDESALQLRTSESRRDFSADGHMFRLVSEANRIGLAYLFDPYLSVHTSLVRPLPHQITAVYGEMLPRQPLRFLLADDPGAGKTIMAGLFIKELMARGDVERCMVIAPGSLVEQWQDELGSKFHLPFEILTNDKMESARTGNWFSENPLSIVRLDKLARDEALHDQLRECEWDLVICDEAHKMSASAFGNEPKYTARYRLGRLISGQTRHFLLLTATPHNGRESDFQLFMRLLDPDRFEGAHRRGVQHRDPTDLMRRLVKEELLKFDGTPLFPERRAYSVYFELSADEQELYDQVTKYVRDEFNRADRLSTNGRGTVGFALTILQRRLASSPEAIYQSLSRRKERLENRLSDLAVLSEGLGGRVRGFRFTDPDDYDDFDEAAGDELEEQEEQLIDEATAATTVEELKAEIQTLSRLESLAAKVRRSEQDRKWDELKRILQEHPEMKNRDGSPRKLVIFTEHLDTLRYLYRRITALIGSPDPVVVISGGMHRNDRRAAQEAFTVDSSVHILIATDAAGEGINLQRAHLMVNYDLPWNPNRLEQRFGRIHRIGQDEVCHLWNLISDQTREGAVFKRLFEKIAQIRATLGGQVFDVLGRVFRDERLEDLLREAIRYGEQPEIRARLHKRVDNLLEQEKVRDLLEERALAGDTMDTTEVARIRQDMDRAEADKLQPYHVETFFREALKRLGGSIRQRETGRYEITNVPEPVRRAAAAMRPRDPVHVRYERVAFDKAKLEVEGHPKAVFIAPGHPLLDATVRVLLERNPGLLQTGTVLVDPTDDSEDLKLLVYLEHTIEEAQKPGEERRRIASRRYQFVELREDGSADFAGSVPYLNWRPLTDSERAAVAPLLAANWITQDLEKAAIEFAVEEIVPEHVREVSERRNDYVSRAMAAVRERLTHEVNYWNLRYVELKTQEDAGKKQRLNSRQAQLRAEELAARRDRRLDDLQLQLEISPRVPVVLGAAVVVPQRLLNLSEAEDEPATGMANNTETERIAMEAVMAAERSLGYHPEDVSARKLGWDVQSVGADGLLRFIEVKGRIAGAEDVSITHNEIQKCVNKGDQFAFAIVEVNEDGTAQEPRYVRGAFTSPPEFHETDRRSKLRDLYALATRPC